MSSLKDPQIYFFLIASVLDDFDHWSYTALSECGMSVIYGQPVLFLMYVICGLVLWKIPQLRSTYHARPTSLYILTWNSHFTADELGDQIDLQMAKIAL